MEIEDKKDTLIKAINELLDIPIQSFNKNLVLSFGSNSIQLSLYDDRLPAGLNKSKICVARPIYYDINENINDNIFAEFDEKEISVNNQIISKFYLYTHDPTNLVTQQFNEAIETCKCDVSFLVDKFFEQVDKNTNYINITRNRNFTM
jgi:hypothetical protein